MPDKSFRAPPSFWERFAFTRAWPFIFCCVLLLPFTSFRFRSIEQSNSVDWQILLRTIPLLVLGGWGFFWRFRRLFSLSLKSPGFLYICFLLWMTLSLAWSSDRLYGGYILLWLWGGYFSVFLMNPFGTGRQGLRAACETMGMIIIVVSLPLYLGGLTVVQGDEYFSNRFYGIFGHPVLFSLLCSVLIGVLLFSSLASLNRKTVVILLLLTFLLVSSTSRTGILSLALAASGCALCVCWTRIGPLKTIALAGVGVLVFIAVSSDILGELLTLGGNREAAETGTLTGRTDFWPAVFALCLQEPLIGFGVGSSKALLYRLGSGEFHPTYAHNQFLQTWLETGLIGLVLSSLTVVIGCLALIRRSWADFHAPLLGVFLLLYFIAASIPEVPFYNYSPYILAFLLTLSCYGHGAPLTAHGTHSATRLSQA